VNDGLQRHRLLNGTRRYRWARQPHLPAHDSEACPNQWHLISWPAFKLMRGAKYAAEFVKLERVMQRPKPTRKPHPSIVVSGGPHGGVLGGMAKRF
jgi:hypothetical protein